MTNEAISKKWVLNGLWNGPPLSQLHRPEVQHHLPGRGVGLQGVRPLDQELMDPAAQHSH